MIKLLALFLLRDSVPGVSAETAVKLSLIPQWCAGQTSLFFEAAIVTRRLVSVTNEKNIARFSPTP
jgi:hypothetical protein